ncbi:conserved oligomeric Golgi complex subunit 4 [Culicoides brevitarsis]|uniref:conserved oligomeric Golgi complex subunit 4 n=1 Tax=Culicoides brevitarsis TaxID=469753 RepID=UPI00307BFABE
MSVEVAQAKDALPPSEPSETLEDINKRLQNILSKQCQVEARILGIGKSMVVLSTAHSETKKLSERLVSTAELAENVSAKVRRLDEARSRVSECQQRVHDLIDLQLCSEGVIQAIRDEDFEKGAAHVNRFLSMDKTLLKRTADDVSESVTSVSQAVATLEKAADQIRQIVTLKFDDAVQRDDMASVERFFKIFPLLGMHDEGIEKFFNYICTKLQSRAEKELRSSMDQAKAEKRMPIAFADTMTVLLETLARVVETNQPLIETYYGYGRLSQVAVLLQQECDNEIRKLVTEFKNNRQISRRIAQINDYSKGSSTSNTNAGHYRKPSGGSVDKLSAKDVDVLINEITIMHSRAELYIKFIKKRVNNDLEASTLTEEEKEARRTNLENSIRKSGLRTQMQELISTYLQLERYFMEESVLKAISLDSYEAGQQNSSMIDDVFFIVRKCIRRSIGTQSFDGVCAVINNAASCLDQDFLNALRVPLKAGYPSGYIDLAQAYNAFQSSIQQGRIQTSDAEQARTNFIVQLNNADKSLEFIDTLWKMMSEEAHNTFPAITQRENEILESCLSGLKSFSDSLKAVIDFGMQQLRSSAVKPRIHPWVDQFQSHNHMLSDEEHAIYESSETFVQSLIVQLDEFLNSFKSQLTQSTYEALIDIVVTDVTVRMERAIKKCTYNRLGSIVLDQEIRTLGSYFTNIASWAVRDKLTRLTQIATLLNVEKVADVLDFYDPLEQGTTWRLTRNEMRTILALRIDFKMDEIKKLKL